MFLKKHHFLFPMIMKELIKALLLFSLFSVVLPPPATAQNDLKTKLEKKRKGLIEKITLNKKLLEKIRDNKQTSLVRFSTLKRQIEIRKQLIAVFRKEVEADEYIIEKDKSVIEALQEDVESLKEEYAKMMRIAYRQKLNNSRLLFVFSADGFADAFNRWQYLRQYDKYRKKQAILIAGIQNVLARKIANHQARMLEREKLLAEEEKQVLNMEKEQGTIKSLISGFKADETNLIKQLREQRKQHEKMNTEIENIIEKQIAAARKAERESRRKPSFPKTPEGEKSAGTFGLNKRKLRWPVNKGVVSLRFGKQHHPYYSRMSIPNKGINISTANNATVYAVFKGKVIHTTHFAKMGYMVLIEHGDYYTVYNRMAEVYVKKGDVIDAGTEIGRVRTNPVTNIAELHFEIWKNKIPLNPVLWLKRK